MRIIVELSGVRDPMQLAKLARHYMEGVVEHNRYLLRLCKESGTPVPPVLKSGVVFRDEPWAGSGLAQMFGTAAAPPLEEFSHLGLVLGRGWGDCMQICGWRVAELREGGQIPIAECKFCKRGAPCEADFRIYCRLLPEGGRLFHVQTRHAPRPRFKDDPRAGFIEDTSRLLRTE